MVSILFCFFPSWPRFGHANPCRIFHRSSSSLLHSLTYPPPPDTASLLAKHGLVHRTGRLCSQRRGEGGTQPSPPPPLRRPPQVLTPPRLRWDSTEKREADTRRSTEIISQREGEQTRRRRERERALSSPLDRPKKRRGRGRESSTSSSSFSFSWRKKTRKVEKEWGGKEVCRVFFSFSV